MADPLSIAAIVALVYAGRKLADGNTTNELADFPRENYGEPDKPETSMYPPGMFEAMSRVTDSYVHPGVPDVIAHQRKQELPSFGVVAPNRGLNSPDMDREFELARTYVSGKMNNVSPVAKTFVGPGLGLDPSVQAAGGFQQFFRVLPNNVGAYRLTTLPGRVNVGADITGGRRGVAGEITHYAPSKTAYLPERRPTVRGRAQGQGGALTGMAVREEYEKSKRTTHRSETSYRGDGLEFGPKKRMVSAMTATQAPTRNKGDLNDQQFYHVDNPQPGIHNFIGAYTDTPEAKLLSGQRPANGFTNAQLEAAGLRGTGDRRSKKDRPGNKGRMNVRNNPLNQNGMMSVLRSDVSRADGYVGQINGSGAQEYVRPMFQDNNPYKGQENRLDLTVAQRQLRNNPFAHTLSA